jgi:twinfilin-like protein
MHQSGIVVNEQLKDEFRTAQEDSDILYIRIEIEDETFIKKGEGKMAGSPEENFLACQVECKPKSPCYILMKSSTKGKWLLIYWVPDAAAVKKKMLIASSFSELKAGLGSTAFMGEYAISELGECTQDEYQKSIGKKDDDNLMTWQEREAKETAYESTISMSETKVSAVVGIAVPLTDNAKKALDEFQAGTVNTIYFSIEPKKELLQCAESGTWNFEELPGKLPPKEPRYILHNFVHDKDSDTQTQSYGGYILVLLAGVSLEVLQNSKFQILHIVKAPFWVQLKNI